MKNKFFSTLFTVLGFAASILPPLWAANKQITLLRNAEYRTLPEILGLTAGGAVIVAGLILVVFWKYFSDFFKRRLRSGRTAFGFFLIGYLIVLAINRLFSTLELIFLFGIGGCAVAIVLFKISDYFAKKGDK